MQDLSKVNERTTDIHSTVPNPYTLLSILSPAQIWYTNLDLKDAFFSIVLALVRQLVFDFEWQEKSIRSPIQLRQTRLSQGFKNSPTLFNEALDQDLQHFHFSHPESPCSNRWMTSYRLLPCRRSVSQVLKPCYQN